MKQTYFSPHTDIIFLQSAQSVLVGSAAPDLKVSINTSSQLYNTVGD